jgi:serine/threonine-protein kinase
MRRDLAVALRDLGGAVMPEEALGSSMQRLFADRIDDKREMLRRVRLGTAVTHLPSAESDSTIDIPVADEGSVIRSTADVVTAPAPPSRRGVALPVAIAALGVAVLALAWREGSRSTVAPPSDPVASSESRPASAPPSATDAPAVQPVEDARTEVVIHVETTPPGARVRIAGRESGPTPTDVRVPRGRDALEIEIAREGHAPLVQTLVPDMDQKLVLSLVPLARGRAAPAAPRPKTTAAPDDGYHRFQ